MHVASTAMLVASFTVYASTDDVGELVLTLGESYDEMRKWERKKAGKLAV